jgi:peroxiredoxin
MAQVGDRIPDVEVRVMNAEGAPETVKTSEVLGHGKVVLFAVPGAFTPGCSKIHLPGYVANADELKAKGVDTIACIAVNDAWVMEAATSPRRWTSSWTAPDSGSGCGRSGTRRSSRTA